MQMPPTRALGFTLLEMLTVLLIISLTALLAYPSYQHYVHKTHRLDAMQSLFHYQSLWQRCLVNQVDARVCLQEIALAPGQTQPSLQGYYQINSEITSVGVRFQAKAVDAQAQDSHCVEFLLDNTGGYKAYSSDQVETTHRCW